MQKSCKKICLQLITHASDIYILGFGFDDNNLKNIGLTGSDIINNNINLNKKRIFISKADDTIIEKVEEITNTKFTESSISGFPNGIFSSLNVENETFGIFCFKKNINEVFSNRILNMGVIPFNKKDPINNFLLSQSKVNI